MAVHTCPRCELRFEREVEVVDHLVADHGVDPDSLSTRPAPSSTPDERPPVAGA